MSSKQNQLIGRSEIREYILQSMERSAANWAAFLETDTARSITAVLLSGLPVIDKLLVSLQPKLLGAVR